MNALDLMRRAVLERPDRCVFVELDRDTLVDMARQNEKRAAYVTMYVPDKFISNLRRKKEERGVFVMVHVPAELERELTSLIITPQRFDEERRMMASRQVSRG